VPDENDQDHYLVDLEQADGQRALNRSPWALGDEGDLWPWGSRNAFTPATTPSSVPYGERSSRIWVENISRDAGDVLVDVRFVEPRVEGQACDAAWDCASGNCEDGVCCRTSCPGQCWVCSRAAGGSVDGVCTAATGRACDDQNPCTRSDACYEGKCAGQPVWCVETACMQAGVCDKATGECVQSAKPDGTACDDGDGCTVDDACRAGVCVGRPRDCGAPDVCRTASVCEPSTGFCSPSVPALDGLPCGQSGVCAAGRCQTAPAESCGGCKGGGAGAAWLFALVDLAGRRRRERRGVSARSGLSG
jgi:hypothetical protein